MMINLKLHSQVKEGMRASSIDVAIYKRDIPALSQMKNIISAKGMQHVAPPKRRGSNISVEEKGLPKNGDPLRYQNKRVSSSASGTTIASFDAHSGAVLNDATGAIGPNHYVYAFNTGLGILDRNGKTIMPEISLRTLFPGESLGDPIVVYDNFADRFVVMEFSNSPNGFLIAVCKGSDPVNDGWSTYRFNTGSFPDYEKLSIWNDGYYITANKDRDDPTANNVVFVVERDKMIAGDEVVQMIGFPLPGVKNNGFYSPGGFNATGRALPPMGVPHSIIYMQDDSWLGVSQDHLKIWTTHIDWERPSSSTISQPQELMVTPFDSVFDNGSFQNLDEPGSGANIDALQATMMYMTNYRRFETYNSVVLNFVVDLDGTDSLAGIRWYELRQQKDNDLWTVFQEGTYEQPDGLSAFCGSIGMDANGNIGLAYTVVGSNVYTSLRYTGRLASDPLGVMTVEEQISANGDSKNNRSDGRYGDYGQLTIDPLDDTTFWHIGEYMKGPTNVRKSHVVAFRIGPRIIDTEAPSSPTNLFVSSIMSRGVSLKWETSVDNNNVVNYDIYQDGNLIANSFDTTFTVTGLTPEKIYSYYVIAKDISSNQSTPSNTVRLTTKESDVNSDCISGDLKLSLTFDDYPEEISWIIKDTQGVTVASKSYSPSEFDGSTVVETIDDLVLGEYIFTIFDSSGDGICCVYGKGTYNLSYDGGIIVSGGEFMKSETITFCKQSQVYELTDINKKDRRFILSPNPVKNDILNIEVDETPIEDLKIFSMYGQLVDNIVDNEYLDGVDISGLSSGTYFVRITADETIITRSFIKE